MIDIPIHYMLFKRKYGYFRNRNRFRADFGATLGDVAVADAAALTQIGAAIHLVERVHLVDGGAREHVRAAELVVVLVRAQDVAHGLAQEAFDALAEFLPRLDFVLI